MIGAWRFALAALVVVYHLVLPLRPLGTYAVFGFYLLSGYLMTRVLHERYGYDARGRLLYAGNRLLRIFPPYWAALAFAAVLLVRFGEAALAAHPALRAFEGPGELLANLILVYPAWVPWEYTPRWVPPSWSLTVELVFYLLIGLGVSRTLPRVLVWLALSIGYVAWTYAAGLDWRFRYFAVGAASLPFALGALLYFLTRARAPLAGREARPWLLAWAAVVLGAAAAYGAAYLQGAHLFAGACYEAGLYLSLALAAVALHRLARGARCVGLSPAMDRRLGDLSYPLYLLHWPVWLLAATAVAGAPFPPSPSAVGLQAFAVAVPLLLGLSTILHHGIERPLEVLRATLRSRAAGGRPS